MKKLLMIFKSFAQAIRDAGFSYIGSVNSSAKMLHSQEESHQYTYIAVSYTHLTLPTSDLV